MCGPYAAGQSGSLILPRTGQTTSYAAGDDGDLQVGAVWPSPRFIDNSIAVPADLTITDNLTGLIWTKNGNLPAATKNWQAALDYVAALNSSNYLGHNDWRLPNSNELESLVNKQQPDMATWLISQGFANVQSDYSYWSSSSSAYSTNYAWVVNMYNSIVNGSSKDGYGY